MEDITKRGAALVFALALGPACTPAGGAGSTSESASGGQAAPLGLRGGRFDWLRFDGTHYRSQPAYPLVVDAPVDAAVVAPPVDAAVVASPVDAAVVAPPVDAAVGATVVDAARSAAAPAHRRCGWIFTSDPSASAVFLANAAWFEAVHPVWYALNADGVTVRALADVDDAAVLAAAAANAVEVDPLVAGVDDVTWVRAMLYSAANRAAHIQTLVALAVAHGYAGLDLDYEHLWDDADAAPLAAFVADLGAAMHAAGKRVSMAVPALSAPSTVWSYAALAAALDHVHVMAYDYHTLGTHEGPVSPLGWVDAVGAQVAATGAASRFLLGLPNYGVTTTTSCTLATCAATCTGPVATSSTHMLTCPFGAYATPERALNCATPAGQLYFDDATSLEEKVASAQSHGLGGVTYWNVGGEAAGFFDMVRSYY